MPVPLAAMSSPRSATILRGGPVREAILDEVKRQLESAGSPRVVLATVLVGDDGPSASYVRSKRRAAEDVGIATRAVEMPVTTTQRQLDDVVAALADDPGVHGVLVQLPLPLGLDAETTLSLIPPDKDVDGLTTESLGRLVRGVRGHVGCTAAGVLRILHHYGIATSGREAVVVGRSTLVGLPTSLLLARKGTDCTVTLAHSLSRDVGEICRRADILVSATGAPRSIRAGHVKPGATVIDVGIARGGDGIIGDVDFDEVVRVAGAVTPMPGGTGLVTVACLIENTLEAARMQGLDIPERTPS